MIPFSEYTKAAGFLLPKPAGVDAFLVLFQALTQNPAWISGHPPGRSAQVLAVALDDLFVPPEAVLAVTFEGAGAVIVGVHIDKAIALAQLTAAGADQVIVASVPSITALNTSDTSERVARGLSVIVSSMFVAVTAILPAALTFVMIIFW